MSKSSSQAIRDLIAKRPKSAVRLQIMNIAMAGNKPVCSFTAEEIAEANVDDVLNDILGQCSQWAASNNRETTFTGDWLTDDDHVARSLQWRELPEGASESLSDGSVESTMRALQGIIQDQHKYTTDLTRLVGAVMENTTKQLLQRIEVLETERAEVLELKENLLIESVNDEDGDFQKENMNRIMKLLEGVITARMNSQKPPED